MTCTCPSGDGSLRWPCPTHPPIDDTVEIPVICGDCQLQEKCCRAVEFRFMEDE